MAEIKVPKPPKSAFNPNRPASDLLKSQVEHLEWAVRHAGERVVIGGVVKARAGYKIKPVKTEADASKRMSALIPKLESAANLPFGDTPIPEGRPPARAKKASRRGTAKRSAKPTVKRKSKMKTKRTTKRRVKRAKR